MTLTHALRTQKPSPDHVEAVQPSAQPIIQPRLRVGAANDPLEREADGVMRRVMDSLSGEARPVAVSSTTRVRRFTDRAETPAPIDDADDAGPVTASAAGTVSRALRVPAEGEPVTPVAGAITRIRRSAKDTRAPAAIGAGGGGLDQETESMLAAQTGRGRKLDAPVRRAMEPRFGHDFAAVRMHDDGAAHELNDRMSAQAFTVGNDIYMSRSAPDASTKAGQGLLAHELTHVVQQGGVAARKMAGSEQDAEDAKQMAPDGRNPKSDRPRGRREGPPDESDEEETEEVEAHESVATETKTKAMRVAVGEYRAAHDRVHTKKKTRLANRSSELSKHKGRAAIAASGVAKGGERAANQGKHGALNAGRSIGRLLGMDVKPSTTVKMAVGANTTNTAAGAYGAVDTEFIEPKFTVKLVGTTWQPILTNLDGTYGKITAPLPAGLAEIAGPDPAESKQQIKDLLALDGADWYMVKAVVAHESIHEDHIHDALNHVGGVIAQLFAALTVDQSVAPTKSDAITAIKNLPGYDAIMNLADPNDSQMRDLWDAEYVNRIGRDHFGPTQTAEADVVEPMINKINDWRKKQKLKKVKKKWMCTDGNNAVHIPKGRKNP